MHQDALTADLSLQQSLRVGQTELPITALPSFARQTFWYSGVVDAIL